VSQVKSTGGDGPENFFCTAYLDQACSDEQDPRYLDATSASESSDSESSDSLAPAPVAAPARAAGSKRPAATPATARRGRASPATPGAATQAEQRLKEATARARQAQVPSSARTREAKKTWLARHVLGVRAATLGKRLVEVDGDGACQFRALQAAVANPAGGLDADGPADATETSFKLRQRVVDHLEANKEVFAGFVPGPWASYVRAMRKQGTWGDHCTLLVAADLLGIRVKVLKEGSVLEVEPQRPTVAVRETIWVCLEGEKHYDALIPRTRTKQPKFE
jgi:hypothetical protein